MNEKDIYETVKCNICGSDSYKIIIRPSNKISGDELAVFRGIKGTQQIVRCNNCGLVYVNPRLNPKFFIQKYTNDDNSIYLDNVNDRRDSFKESLKFIETYYPKKGKILDIGTAAGVFLEAAKNSGWKTYGVELNKLSTIFANKKYGVNVKQGILQEIKFKDNFFDVVTMWDVLEHIPDPDKELKEIFRILKPGGILVINFPDFGSLIARIFGSKWWFVFSVHLFYFDRNSMTKILKKNKFKNYRFKKYWQSLSLGYLATTIRLYNKNLSKLMGNIFKILNLDKLKIKYYAGQSTVIARKN